MAAIQEPQGVVILPMHNERAAAAVLLPQLRAVLDGLPGVWRMVVVDDASGDGLAEVAREAGAEVIRLAVNVGHQAAIRQGLEAIGDADWCVVMDGDGEDDPAAILRLWAERVAGGAVFARRGRREEGLRFRAGYVAYKLLYRAVIGRPMRHGNFSLIHRDVAQRLQRDGFVHFAAALDRLRVPSAEVVVDRLPRLAGHSKMNYERLALHGLMSLVEQSEAMVHAMFRVFLLVILGISGLLMFILQARFVSETAIPGWSSTLLVGLANAGLICFIGFILGLVALNFQKRKTK
jgi:glycosyltransferase involved in cell wall biosynthesis